MSNYRIKEAFRHLPKFPFEGKKISLAKAEEDAEKYIELGYGTYYEKVKGSNNDEYVEPEGFADVTEDQLRDELTEKQVSFRANTGRRKLIEKVLENRG